MKDFVNEEHALNILKNNGVVAIPTETVYGLAAQISSDLALRSIFEIKKRPFFDPLIVHISHLQMLSDLVLDPHPVLIKLAQKFWPGPLTIVFDKNPNTVSDLITSSLPTVGIRWPNHPLTEKLISKLNVPLAAPSANPFKKTSPTEAKHVRNYFPDLPVLDGGPCEVGLESTIVKLNSNTLEILRPGGISKLEIEDFFNQQKAQIVVVERFDTEGPGSMPEHYQPLTPLHIFLNTPVDLSKDEFKNKKVKRITLPEDARVCARLLYKTLIESSGHSDFMILEWTHDINDPDWSAIFNRLKKAAKVIY